MLITPNGYEIVQDDTPDYEGTAEKAISIGFEDAMADKDRKCDYEFTIETKNGVKYIHCEIKHEDGYQMMIKHKESEDPNLPEIERQSYQFLLERL